MTMTKKEAATALAGKGIALPDNWSKLSTERAVTWATNWTAAHERLMAPVPELDALPEADKAEVKGFLARAKDKVKSSLGLEKAARKNAAMKVFSDPMYRRTTNKLRRFMAANTPPKVAVNPEKPTRQMWRRFQIDQHKQPLEMSQEDWHKTKGYGKVQPFGSSIRQVRNKRAKAERAVQAAKAAAHIRNVAMGA